MTGLFDLDVTNPSIGKIMQLQNRREDIRIDRMIIPILAKPNLKVISVDFFLPGSDQPITLKGEMRAKVIQQFVRSVDFGDLDVVVIDSPPTTSEELLSIMENYDKEKIEAVFVSQPSDVSVNGVIKSIRMLKERGMPIKGIISNMDKHKCSNCGHMDPIFVNAEMTVEDVAKQYRIPFLGSLPTGLLRTGYLLTDPYFNAIAEKVLTGKSVKFKPEKGHHSWLSKFLFAFRTSRNLDKILKDNPELGW